MVRTLKPGRAEWPPLLAEMHPLDPPARLLALGRPIDITAPMIAIVGTRRPTVAGVELAEAIAKGLAEAGFTIVSGLATGIDAAAHRGALQAGGATIAVLGCGLSHTYPKRNAALRRDIEEAGTVLTEYEDAVAPTRYTFPRRNRIVAGMGVGTVVVEGGIHSGAMITARMALDMNRNVYAVPGSLRNPMAAAPNELIKTGRAALVTSFKDICDDLAPNLLWSGDTDSVERPSSEEMQMLLLLDDAPTSAAQLVSASDLPAGEVAMALSRLEIRGWATRSHRGYSITDSGAKLRSAVGTEA